MRTVSLEGLGSLMQVLRETRVQIAATRADGLRDRYPEVDVGEVAPLSDTELVRIALQRELRHQEQVLSDLKKERG